MIILVTTISYLRINLVKKVQSFFSKMEFLNTDEYDVTNLEYEIETRNTFYLNEKGEVMVANVGQLWQITGLFLVISIVISKFKRLKYNF